MLTLWLASAFALPATAQALSLVDLNFNITVPANSSCTYYGGTGWTQDGDNVVVASSPGEAKGYLMSATGVSTGVCFHGKFDSTVKLAVQNGASDPVYSTVTSSDDETTACVKAPYTVNTYRLNDGVQSLSSITFLSRMKAPSGSTTDDIVVTNLPFVKAGKVSSELDLTFRDMQAPPPIALGGLNLSKPNFDAVNITLPANTTYFVLNAPSDVSFGPLAVTMYPVWPDPSRLAPGQLQSLKTSGVKVNAPPSPIWFSGTLDPTIQYIVMLATGAGRPETGPDATGSGGGYVISSIDLYSVKEKPPSSSSTTSPQPTQIDQSSSGKSASIVGPAVGGAIGGLVLLGLLGFGVWWLRRRSQRKRCGEGDKFIIDPDNEVATPFTALLSATAAPEFESSKVNPRGRAPEAREAPATEGAAFENIIRERDGGGFIQGKDLHLPPLYDPSWGGQAEGSGYSDAHLPSSSQSQSPGASFPSDKQPSLPSSLR